MMQSLLEIAKDLVAELIRVHHLEPENARAILQMTHHTLSSLYDIEMSGADPMISPPHEEDTKADWKRSISIHVIRCLECGAPFRQLSARHLSTHDLTPRSYRSKYGIPSKQWLSAREVTVRRRALAKQIRPWEGAAAKRAAAKTTAKAAPGQGTAK